MEIKFMSIKQMRAFKHVLSAHFHYDDKAHIEQRSDSGCLILANRVVEYEIKADGTILDHTHAGAR